MAKTNGRNGTKRNRVAAYSMAKANPGAAQEKLREIARKKAIKEELGYQQQLQAAYDLADADAEISEQFGRARHESGKTGLSPGDRRRMIDRSRYEIFQANPWLKGMVRSNTVSVVGRGPEIEVKIEGREKDAQRVERLFNHWLKVRKAGRKLRAMANAKQSDGAGLAQVQSNTKDPVHGITLDFQPFDDDHIKAPRNKFQIDRTEHLLDGKEYDDETGEPIRYWRTPKHPAEHPESEPVPVDAEFILDIWNYDRPSQGRGAPEYSTSLRNGPLSRSFRRATLDSATTAAKHTAVLETNVDRFDSGDVNFQGIANWVTIPTQYGMMTAVPYGWKMNQMRAEHPNTNHEAFMRSLGAEHGRANNQPAYIALGDGLGLNMSSMTGLRQEWELEVDVQRQEIETEGLAKLFKHWLEEAMLTGLVGRDLVELLLGTSTAAADTMVAVAWRWTKRRHQDTNREYMGRKASIESGARSRHSWMVEDGINPEAEDKAAAESFGMTIDEYRQMLAIHLYGDAARNVLGLPTASQGGAEQNDDPEASTEGDDAEADDPEGGSDDGSEPDAGDR